MMISRTHYSPISYSPISRSSNPVHFAGNLTKDDENWYKQLIASTSTKLKQKESERQAFLRAPRVYLNQSLGFLPDNNDAIRFMIKELKEIPEIKEIIKQQKEFKASNKNLKEQPQQTSSPSLFSFNIISRLTQFFTDLIQQKPKSEK